ncbi:TonB-dependent receptor [Chromobacterium sp. IIBBL 290-4]|uniref:TonB-dependent receptor n=1 Tax=Chromobacterium sp. IIBBL 290-4 TaxID=2953890 RepID=UPI0020B755D3|nr:TonB-dependent receptor [Chromobacterium sp. IIBBL 290-4]UTH74272.1 TonB-dependent receptor [Chromobacterium sp. IIBBL 290-4]
MKKAPRRQHKALTQATLLALACLGGLPHSVQAAPADTQDNQTTLPAVTVTGEKVKRSLKDTTTAVSVLRDVDNGETKSIYDSVVATPNATANGAGIINIRGVEGTGPGTGYNTLASGSRPRVSTTVDGLTESWNGQRYVDASPWDVEQVEVLRGPQSTTQGRNTLAGAIVVNTKDPTFDWEGALRAGYENKAGKTTLAGMVSGPITEELAFRLSAEGLDGHSYINYPGAMPWDGSKVSNSNVRGKLLWKPGAVPGFTAKLTVSHRENKGEYLNYVDGYYFDYNNGRKEIQARTQDSSNDTVSTDLQYQFNSDWSANLLLGHADNVSAFKDTQDFRMRLDEKSNTAEARLNYAPENGWLSGMIGAYYYDRDQNMDAQTSMKAKDKVKTTSLYGEATFRLNPQWSLGLGGRIERETQRRDITGGPGTPREGQAHYDIGDTLFLPKAEITYKLSPTTTLGASVRKGYNAGGSGLDDNTDKVTKVTTYTYYTYEKEEVTAYELSSRSTFWNERVSLNANAFFNQYTDYQAILNRRFTNIPKGESYGLELEAKARVTPKLTVSAGLGLLNTEVTQGTAANPEIKGKQFNYAPHMTLNLGFKQKLINGFYVGGSLNRVGSYYSEITNDRSAIAGGYTVANLNAGYEDARWGVRAYVNNLTNRNQLVSQISVAGQYVVGVVGAPRTVGMTVDYHF